jgi:hypothetical protein
MYNMGICVSLKISVYIYDSIYNVCIYVCMCTYLLVDDIQSTQLKDPYGDPPI